MKKFIPILLLSLFLSGCLDNTKNRQLGKCEIDSYKMMKTHLNTIEDFGDYVEACMLANGWSFICRQERSEFIEAGHEEFDVTLEIKESCYEEDHASYKNYLKGFFPLN